MAGFDAVRNLTDPARGFHFEVKIPNMPGGGNGEEVGLRCTSTTVPGFQSEPTEIALGGGHVISYAGRGTTAHEWTFSVIEGENMVVYNSMESWHALQWNRSTGAQRPSSEYKTDVFIQQLAGDKSVVKTWKLEGCFIATIGDITYDHNSSEPVRFDTTLRFDKITPQ
jgi:hypothetical protein